ncbi:MAG: TolC family protein [Prevotella pallens]|uniref:TolC family protein n=1 Tax=Prevotella pallens TaxID=60133 RepID=UPI001CB62E14|nr:TolC family protein [Prevotella pallens]MBF1443311.1 TolC family protein [Prevotella pallens]MBF1459492.1 TolC family protein [Prevotella pallens]MBF1490805.1 TolC family protein [Prevotella pallens]MBF1492836.1 TolC family protein [Prevotella pallens]
MRTKFIVAILLILASTTTAQTLEECQKAAEKNYPLIKQYGLIAQTTDLTVSNIQKEWLPKIAVSAQATYQSNVVAWPERIQSIYQQMGLTMKGLKKDQYKMAIDLQQTLYDGGTIASKQAIARQEAKVQEAENQTKLYEVHHRVNEMYFALLLLNEQIKLNNNVKSLLLASENKLAAMVKSGTAATSDLDNIKAERLSAEQQYTSLKAEQQMLQHILTTFCGIKVENVQKPTPVSTDILTNNRPELQLFNSKLKLSEAQEKALNTRLHPTLALFAQGYYGYPGMNMFNDMIEHKWRLNGIVGVKLSWNVGALYTRKNDKARLRLQRELIENERKVFLFNNSMEQIRQNSNINRFKTMMQTDKEIIALRTNVRKAAESKLLHGIIDVNSLLREINNENAAKVQWAIHEIDMLKEMYNLKYTNNQ